MINYSDTITEDNISEIYGTVKPIACIMLYKGDNNSYIEYSEMRLNTKTCQYENGPFKPITKSFKNKFGKWLTETKETTFSGFIPKNIVYLSIVNEDLTIAWYNLSKERNVLFSDEENELINVPNILYVATKETLKVYYFDKIVNDYPLNIWPYPFSNINFNGDVCMGNVDIDIKEDDFEVIIKKWESYFWNSKFTSKEKELIELIKNKKTREYFKEKPIKFKQLSCFRKVS